MQAKAKDNCVKPVLSLHLYVGSRDQAQVISQAFQARADLLSHLSGSGCVGYFVCLFVCFPRQDPVLKDALSTSGTLSAFCLLDFLLPLRCQLKRAILGNTFCSPPRLVDLSQSSHSLKSHTHLQDSLPPASP